MSIDELKISIEWKKRFYSYYKEKLESLGESKYATLSNNWLYATFSNSWYYNLYLNPYHIVYIESSN